MNRCLARLVLFVLALVLIGVVFGVARADALTFAPKTDFAAGDTPSAVAVGDFNGDGHVDLAVADWWADSVSILIGDGLGGFAAPVSPTLHAWTQKGRGEGSEGIGGAKRARRRR